MAVGPLLRPMKYAGELASLGHEVDVVTMRYSGFPIFEVVDAGALVAPPLTDDELARVRSTFMRLSQSPP